MPPCALGENVPSATGGFVPSIDTREISTQVLVNNGETVVLGGVYVTEQREVDSKVPILGDLPGVGANLQDHLQLRLIYRVSGVETLNQRVASLWGKARIALEYAISRSGPMSMSPSQLGAFAKSDPDRATANLFARYEFSEKVTLFGEAKFSRTEAYSESQPTFDFFLWLFW